MLFFNKVLPLFALSLLTALIAPLSVYNANPSEITWQGGLWLQVWFWMLLVLPIWYGVSSRWPSLFEKFNTLLLMMTCYGLVRICFYPVNYGALVGNNNYEIALFSDLSIASSIALFFIIYLCSRFFNNALKWFIIISMSIMLMPFAYSDFTSPAITTNKQQLPITTNSYNTFSSKQNIIVLSFDSIQNDPL